MPCHDGRPDDPYDVMSGALRRMEAEKNSLRELLVNLYDAVKDMVELQPTDERLILEHKSRMEHDHKMEKIDAFI